MATLLALTGCLLLVVSISGAMAAMAPLLLLFSPVLVPAAGAMALGALAIAGLALLASDAIAALTPRDYVAEGKRRVAELSGEKTSHVEAGHLMQGDTFTNPVK